MANKKITDLPATTAVNDADVFEKVTLPASTDASEKVTSLQFKNYVVPGEVSLLDDVAIEFFDGYPAGALVAPNLGVGWGAAGVITGGTIVSRTEPATNSRTFNALSISNGQYGRRMPWGDRWNKLKLAIAWRLNGVASFNTTATDALFGICSGTTNMAGSATTDNFVGLRWGSGAGDGITFTAGTLINYYNMSTAFRIVTRRNVTTTALGSGGSGHSIPATEGYMGLIVLNVWRPVFANDAASVTYSYMEVSNGAADVELGHQKNAINRLLEDTNTSATSSSNQEQAIVGASSGSITGAFDQSTGKLDTVNIFWPFTNANATLELCGFGVRKLA